MLDGIVELIIVQVLSSLDLASSIFTITILIPHLVSTNLRIMLIFNRRFLAKYMTSWLNNKGRPNPMGVFPLSSYKLQDLAFIIPLVIVGMVAERAFAETTNLSAAYLVEAFISRWNSAWPH